MVELSEDPISTFFSLDQCPKVLFIPTGVDESTGEVIRADDDLTIVHCQYADT